MYVHYLFPPLVQQFIGLPQPTCCRLCTTTCDSSGKSIFRVALKLQFTPLYLSNKTRYLLAQVIAVGIISTCNSNGVSLPV